MKDYIDSFNEAGFSVLKKNGRIIISSPRMTIIGQSDNTLWTAKDILCSECYGFASTEKFIALDIGQNIGIASLYFAFVQPCFFKTCAKSHKKPQSLQSFRGLLPDLLPA